MRPILGAPQVLSISFMNAAICGGLVILRLILNLRVPVRTAPHPDLKLICYSPEFRKNSGSAST